MKTPTKFAKPLTEEEHNRLMENHQKHENFRVRNRSHAIRVSAEGYAIDEIAVICRVHRNTVSRWINRWNEFGFDALADRERHGRPAILTAEEKKKAVEMALENLRFPARELGRISEEIGKQISVFTLKGLIKKRLFVEKNQIGNVEKDDRR